MAKNIKAIQCPKCGSVKKTELKPDYFRCDNCGTEYFLDNDDININIRNTSVPPQGNILADGKRSRTLGVVIVAIVILTILLINIFSRSNSSPASPVTTEAKYNFGSAGSIVYQNTNTGKAVYMRIGREFIEDENQSNDYVNTHVLFIDPISKKIMKDDLLMSRIRRLDDYFPSFQVFNDGTIYMLYPGARLFTIDREADKLVEVTKSLFKNHPELSVGIATISLNEDYLDLLTNDGHKYFYIPKSDVLTTEYDGKDSALKVIQPDISFKFTNDELLKMTPKASTNISPDRKYFRPEIVYQDKQSLIIASGATASPQAPKMLQSIDINTGKIIWSLPAKSFYYDSGARCKEGFAIEYSSGSDQDYISGILVISPEGKIVSDYQLDRSQ
ncbi:hypothetical protein [Pedobacter duraquae]|uniref:Uncharacterized protein n=1 Tax=Pedobacter duraquae TaxID=425511 RepID=A0A4R6IG61_9SPHI|nr:hypothetical protein [Pedobacter duraquae]TDO21340.1 hypothetical protein CLV32_2445 [Pedobacter duraquae]